MSPTSLLNFMLLKTDTFLQLLYLKELTMQKESPNISTRIISLKGSGLISSLEKSRTTETFIAAAAGMGRPSKSMLDEELVLIWQALMHRIWQIRTPLTSLVCPQTQVPIKTLEVPVPAQR